MALHTLELCAGYGGLGLGVHLAVPGSRTVCHVEREAAAVEVLASRMEDGTLDEAPIWSDVGSFDGRPWSGAVDLIAAGIPCQPWSVAGSKRGFDDDRHLGEELVRIVGEVGPRLVLVENVPGFLRLGLPDLLGRLADLGFDAEWGVFSAAAVGAPHLRKRLFVLAYAKDDHGCSGERGAEEGARPDGERRGGSAVGGGAEVADPDSGRLQEQRLEGTGKLQRPRWEEPHGRGGTESSLGFPLPWPPGPGSAWEGIPSWLHPALPGRNGAKRLNPCFVEWPMGLPPFWSLPHAIEGRDQESRPAGAPQPEGVPSLRCAATTRAAPPRLRQPGAGRDPVPTLPRQGGQAGRHAADEVPEAVHRLRDAIRLHPHPCQDLWPNVPLRTRAAGSGKEVGRSLQDEDVRRLLAGVHVQARQRQDLWARRMRELTQEERHAAAMAERVDRLRMLGNGVVPLVAAHAFRTLSRRIR